MLDRAVLTTRARLATAFTMRVGLTVHTRRADLHLRQDLPNILVGEEEMINPGKHVLVLVVPAAASLVWRQPRRLWRTVRQESCQAPERVHRIKTASLPHKHMHHDPRNSSSGWLQTGDVARHLPQYHRHHPHPRRQDLRQGSRRTCQPRHRMARNRAAMRKIFRCLQATDS